MVAIAPRGMADGLEEVARTGESGLPLPKASSQAMGASRHVRGASVDPHLVPPFPEVLHPLPPFLG